MHYILGTSFVTPSRLGTSSIEKQFQPNTWYQLIYIQKKDQNDTIYSFTTGNRERLDITFSNCREADKLIARFKRENIPDYEAQYNVEITSDEV